MLTGPKLGMSVEAEALLTLTVQTGSNIGNPVPLLEKNSSNKRERERERERERDTHTHTELELKNFILQRL